MGTNSLPKARFGADNHMWRGGRTVASNGYILVRVGVGHHLADVRGYAYEHRVNAEQKIGRRLEAGEQVHHIDGNKQNNTLDNLEVCSSAIQHWVHHRSGKRRLRMPDEPNVFAVCECGCGTSFRMFDGDGRYRRFIHGHNLRRRNG